MPTCTTHEEAWTQFLQFAKAHCSPVAFGNWLAPINVVENDSQELVLEIPNVFVQDYLLSNYKQDLCAFLPVNGLGEPAIRFVIAAQKKQAVQSMPVVANESVSEVPAAAPARNNADVKLNLGYLFENFIEGPSNQFVKSAAMGVALKPAHSYNPLFIHGGVGLGKTHLLHSIGHFIRQHHKKLNIQCITAEAFINDLVDSLRNKSIDRMKRFYRSEIDVLLVDDIQFLQNRLNFEEELSYTFEALKNKGAQIVITSDQPPSSLKLSRRTISKMEGGLVALMGAPELETRVAILQAKAEQKGLHIPYRVAVFIAEHICDNVRQLEGAINRLSAHCRLMNLNVTEELVSKTLCEMLQHAPREKISVEQILKSVADIFELRVSDLKSTARTKDIALARQVAMYLAKDLIHESLIMLGEAFGKTHSTILHAYKNIEKQLALDVNLRRQVDVARRNVCHK